jgi:hypothetical protein
MPPHAKLRKCLPLAETERPGSPLHRDNSDDGELQLFHGRVLDDRLDNVDSVTMALIQADAPTIIRPQGLSPCFLSESIQCEHVRIRGRNLDGKGSSVVRRLHWEGTLAGCPIPSRVWTAWSGIDAMLSLLCGWGYQHVDNQCDRLRLSSLTACHQRDTLAYLADQPCTLG